MEEEVKKENVQYDIVWLLKYLFAKKWFIAKVVGVATVLCIVMCLCKSKVFTATASLLPVEESSSIGGNLSSLASMAGIDLGSASSSTIITPDLYPKVAQSTPFLLKVMNVKVPWIEPDTTMSMYEHALADTVPSFGKTLKKYTIGLPGTILKAINPPPVMDSKGSAQDQGYVVLDKTQRALLMSLQNSVLVDINDVYGTIEISVNGESAIQASMLTKAVIDLLQETVTEHKTRRAKQVYDFIEGRYNESLKEYEAVREAFFAYKDRHRNMIEERVDAEYQRLSDQYQLSYSILKTLSGQMEQSKLEIMEDTPVFSVVEPVVVPEKKSSPKMSLHIIAGVLLGGIGAVGWLLMQLAWWQMFDTKKMKALIEQYK